MSNDLLVDTHILIWLINGDSQLPHSARELIKKVSGEGFIFISAISVWEITLLEQKGRIVLNQPIEQWVQNILSLPYFKIIDISYKIAIESHKLPGELHGAPADRLIVATSRIHNIPLITGDKKILAYGEQSFVQVIECC